MTSHALTPAPGSLWRHRDFRHLWSSETVSQVGTQITLVALPVLAVTILHATPFEMGVLTALETVAFLVIGLPAGAWVDRWHRKRVLVANDLVRAVALGTLPVAWALGVLGLPQLFVVATITGTATVFFDVAWQSYLPNLVAPKQVVDGNSKLSASQEVARVAGPGIAGVLLKVLGAPLLISFDAASYLLSALFLAGIRHTDTVPDRATRRKLRTEIAEGLSFVVRHPLLRRIVSCTGIFNLFSAMTMALLVLYILRTLGLSASTLGFVFSVGAVGGIIGAATAAWFARAVGEGRAIPLGALVSAVGFIGVPLAALGAPVVLLVVGWFVTSWGVVAYNVTQVSFRQRLCPPNLLGRMNASVRFIVYGTMPLGGLLGGVLGDLIGVLPTLWVATVGGFVACLPVVLSPLMRMGDLPDEWDRGQVAATVPAEPGMTTDVAG